MDMLNAAAPMGVDMNEWTVPPDPPLGAPIATFAHSQGLPNLFQCLVDDSIQKQAALEHVQRAADHAAQRSEISSWRLRDLDGRNRALSGDVEALRKMLHESKDGAISADEVEQLRQLNAKHLVERCKAYAARAQMERTRCAELLKRLKVFAQQFPSICMLYRTKLDHLPNTFGIARRALCMPLSRHVHSGSVVGSTQNRWVSTNACRICMHMM